MDRVESNESFKQSSFYSTYTSFCKSKNMPAILELIKSKHKLDLVVDRIRSDQWAMVCKSLKVDETLGCLVIRSRKSSSSVNEKIEPDTKRLNIIAPLTRAVSGCVKRNLVMTKLALEGLPLTVDNIQTVCIAISRNSSLKTLSFARSNITDYGCNVICSTVRELPNIEKLNVSHCGLTAANGAHHIGELIKFQTIRRNSEGWMKSLRYRDVDVDSAPGLKCLILNGNQLNDNGLATITSKLIEDVWIQAIEMQNCGVTDVGGEAVLHCLEYNKTLVVFDVSHNYQIGNSIHKKIQMMLSMEPNTEDHVMRKVSNSDLREKMEYLEQQLALETFNRERADHLNVQLHRNLLIKCNEQTATQKCYEPPSGFKIMSSNELNALYTKIGDLTKAKACRTNIELKQVISAGKGSPRVTEQYGFGDSLEITHRPCCTQYSDLVESLCNVSSKFDGDAAITLNSND